MTDADATLPLQRAIIAALKADTTVASYVGTRVYDAVSNAAVLPYISFGPVEVASQTAHGLDATSMYTGSETTIQLDAWSSGPGSVEVKQIGRAIKTAMHYVDLSLESNQRLILLEVQSIQYLVDPDGLTQHGVVILRALTEPSV